MLVLVGNENINFVPWHGGVKFFLWSFLLFFFFFLFSSSAGKGYLKLLHVLLRSLKVNLYLMCN